LKGYRYLLNKIAWACLTVLFVVVLNFFLFRILPGDPARAGIRDPRMTVQAQEAIRVRFGLDKPVINCFESLNPLRLGKCAVNPLDTQFFIYIRNLLRGELGFSYHTNRPVVDMIGERLWNTILLTGPAQILSIVLGMALGLLAAWKAHTAIDYAALVGSLVAWSVPTFWLGILLLFWGSSKLGLPIGGKMTAGATFATAGEQVVDIVRHMILPTVTFTIVYMGEYMLYMRSTVLEVLAEDYTLTAKAKGLKTSRILRAHALPNALLPMVTIIALNLGFIVSGAIFIETVFSWPGLGLAVYEALNRRDYPMLQGLFLLLAISVVLANLIAELLYSVLDPRIKTG